MRRLYLATKLFNPHDRLTSLNLCETVDGWIDEGLLTNMAHCFLPFRDSNNEIPDDVEDAGQAIFDLDIETMNACDGVIGFFDGPAFDSGVAFEIGYAYTLGYPITMITTDYFTISVHDSPQSFPISSLIMFLAYIIHVAENDLPIEDYRESNNAIINLAVDQLRFQLINDFGDSSKSIRPKLEPQEIMFDYYLDPNFSYTEGGRALLTSIISALQAANKTYVLGENFGNIPASLNNLAQSGQAIYYADPFDPNVDSSLLQGISFGLGRLPILYSSNEQWYDWRNPFKKNIMIQYSSAAVVSSVDELIALITP